MGTVTTVGRDAFEGLLVPGSEEKEWTEVGVKTRRVEVGTRRHSNETVLPDYRIRLRR